MDCCCVKQMVIDLVVIRNRSNHVCADVLFIIEGLQFAPYPAIAVFDKLRLRIVVIAHWLSHRHIRIIPLLDLDDTGPIVDLVSDVGGLCADVANLSHKGDLTQLASCEEIG